MVHASGAAPDQGGVAEHQEQGDAGQGDGAPSRVQNLGRRGRAAGGSEGVRERRRPQAYQVGPEIGAVRRGPRPAAATCTSRSKAALRSAMAGPAVAQAVQDAKPSGGVRACGLSAFTAVRSSASTPGPAAWTVKDTSDLPPTPPSVPANLAPSGVAAVAGLAGGVAQGHRHCSRRRETASVEARRTRCAGEGDLDREGKVLGLDERVEGEARSQVTPTGRGHARLRRSRPRPSARAAGRPSRSGRSRRRRGRLARSRHCPPDQVRETASVSTRRGYGGGRCGVGLAGLTKVHRPPRLG